MSNCKSCGNSGCGGNCEKDCIKIYRPTIWKDGDTGIPGEDGNPGIGIVNIVDNEDGTFTIYLSDSSSYIITMPAATGKHVVDINPVVGDDTQWELVYDDASTVIIDSPYYLVNQGVGQQLIFNQASHPSFVRTLQPKNSNAKILTTLSGTGNEIDFNVKQFGRQDNLLFQDLSGATSYATTSAPRFENAAGGMSIVFNGGSPVVSNETTDEYELSIVPIDAYHCILYYRIIHSFDLLYNDISYNNAVKGRFHFILGFNLPQAIAGIPNNFWHPIGAGNDFKYYQGNHSVGTYDFYRTGETTQFVNKLRRYGEHKIADAYLQPDNASTDPGFYGNTAGGVRLVFRYPYIDGLVNPGVGETHLATYKFEAVGSIMCHLSTDTDQLSTYPGIKNH